MQIDRDTPPGRYLIRGTEASLIVERTATATGMRTIARPVDPTSAPPGSGWHLPLPDPIRNRDTAI